MNLLDTSAASACDDSRTKRILLSDGFSAPEDFFQEEIRWVRLRLRELSPDPSYTAKQLAGKERWGLLPDGDRKLLGRCIAYAVCRGLLPLEFVRGRHEYPLRYRLCVR